MAIIYYGRRVTGLTPIGVPGGIFGLLATPPVIPLNFTLPVAGPVTADLDFDPQECQVKNDHIQLVVFVVDNEFNIINVRDASSLKIKLLTPSGVTKERTASFLTSGVDGAIQYTTNEKDLEEPGTYKIQAEYIIGGETQSTRLGTFRVGPNVDDC